MTTPILIMLAIWGWVHFTIEYIYARQARKQHECDIRALKGALVTTTDRLHAALDKLPYCHDCGEDLSLGDIANGAVYQCLKCREEYESG